MEGKKKERTKGEKKETKIFKGSFKNLLLVS